ncbi:MAG: RNA polymerase sigma factor [Cyclobacteriaceae bacterium]
MTEEELISECLKGGKGQRLLYEHYVKKMGNLCLRYCSNNELAQDALVEGFMKVFQSIDKFQYMGVGSLTAWISRIMVNNSLEILRKEKRHFDVLDSAKVVTAIDANWSFDHEELVNCIKSLPDGYRTVFNMAVIDGYNHSEIASELGITESASRSQLARARTRLQEMLKEGGWYG